MARVTQNDLLDAMLVAMEKAAPLAPPYPEWLTLQEIIEAFKKKGTPLNGNQAHIRMTMMVKAGTAEKKRAPRRTGSGIAQYYRLSNGKKP